MQTFLKFTLLLTAFVLLNACDRTKPDVAPADNTVPAAVVGGLRQAFPLAESIRFSVVETQNVWNAEFKQRARSFEAKLNTTGVVLEAFRQAQTGEELPAAVKTYITATYRGFQLVSWSVSTETPPTYRVVLEQPGTRLIVDVDAQGKLINRYTTAGSVPSTNVFSLQLTDLPQPIQTYLVGYTFRQVTIILADGKRTYAISAIKGNDTYLLLFDEAGNLIKSEVVKPGGSTTPPTGERSVTQVAQSTLLAPITDFLNTQYAGWSFRAASAYFSGGKPIGYEVSFSQSGQFIAYFDENGAFLRVKKQ